MRKYPLTIFFDLTFLLFLGVILLIISTGGFTFSVGALHVSAYSLKNPTIGIIITLLLRKVFTGKFLQGFVWGTSFRGHFEKSQRFRKMTIAFPFLVMLVMGFIVLINPLQHGLRANYYDNTTWSGSPIMTTKEYALNLYRMQTEQPTINDIYSIQWKGALFIPKTGEYEFISISDNDSEIQIDNQLVVNNRGFQTLRKQTGRVDLEKGFHSLEVRYMQENDSAQFEVYWGPPEKKRERLSSDWLYLEEPTKTEFFVGRCLETGLIICKFLLVSILLVGFSNRRLMSSSLNTSFIGKAYSTCCSWITKENMASAAYPVLSKNHFAPFLIAFISYTLLSLGWTYPLILDFSTKMFGWGGDRYIYLWNMWWMKKALLELHTSPFYTDYLFYPKGISLAFHDFSLLLTTISLPLQWMFSLEEIYNILFLATYALGGAGCFLLVRYLTGDNLAAFLSGIVFAFWGGRAYYTDHLYLASIQWIPYCALFMIKTLREPSYRNPIVGAVFLALNTLTSWVYAVYMTLFVIFFLLYSVWTERRSFITSGCMKRFGVAGVLFFILILPVVFPMVLQIFEGEQYMNAPVLPEFSASLNTLFLPSVNHGILGKYATYLYLKAGIPVERGLTGGLFIGYTVLLLCLYTSFKLRDLKSKFWILAALFFLLLSLGPHLRIFSQEYRWIPLPYIILDRIPILKTVRVPERFVIMVMFCCSVLVGYACGDIFRRIRFRKALFFLLLALILFEFFRFYRIGPVEQTPAFYKELAQDSEPYAILELTRLTELEHAARRSSLFQITHEKKLFNGFVARVSPETYLQAYKLYRVFDDFFQPREYLEQPNSSVLKIDKNTLLTILAYYNVRYIALYYDYKHGRFQENIKRLTKLFGQPVAEQSRIYLFKVDKSPFLESVAFPGHGMFPVSIRKDGTMIRKISKNADIRVLNLNQYQMLQLQFQAQSTIQPREVCVQIFVNEHLMKTVFIGDWMEITIPRVAIKPGENTIIFRMPDVEDWRIGVYMRNLNLNLL